MQRLLCLFCLLFCAYPLHAEEKLRKGFYLSMLSGVSKYYQTNDNNSNINNTFWFDKYFALGYITQAGILLGLETQSVIGTGRYSGPRVPITQPMMYNLPRKGSLNANTLLLLKAGYDITPFFNINQSKHNTFINIGFGTTINVDGIIPVGITFVQPVFLIEIDNQHQIAPKWKLGYSLGYIYRDASSAKIELSENKEYPYYSSSDIELEHKSSSLFRFSLGASYESRFYDIPLNITLKNITYIGSVPATQTVTANISNSPNGPSSPIQFSYPAYTHYQTGLYVGFEF